MKNRSMLVCLALLALASMTAPLAAASIIGPPVQTKDGGSFYPAISYNATSDQYLVVWGQYTSRPQVRGQRVSANSEDLLGAEFAVGSWSAEYNTYIQCMTYNPDNGEWFVIYIAELQDQEDNLYGQRIDSAGNQIGGIISLVTDASYQNQAAIAYNTINHRYLLTWTDHTNLRKVRARLFDQYGSPIGSVINVSDSSPNAKSESKLAYNPVTNEFLVIWSDQRNWNGQGNDNDWVDLYGQRINGSTGALIGVNVMVAGPTSVPYVGDGLDRGEITANPTDGKYFLAITRLVATGWVTMGRILNPDATPYTSIFNVSYPERGWTTGLVYNPLDNTFIMSYLAADYELSAKQYSATGSQTGSVIPVFRTSLYEENSGWLAIRPSDGLLMQVTTWFENLVTHTTPKYVLTQRFKTGADTHAPSGPISFRAYRALPTTIRLTWTNPRDSDVSRAMIRRRSDTYPASITDGTLVCDRSASAGTSDSFTDTIGTSETRYYSLFSRDSASPSPNYSTPVHAVSSNVWLNEAFDNYALGYLDMQGGWTRSDNAKAACFVQDAVRVGATGKAVEIFTNSGWYDEAGVADFGSITGDYHKISFDMRRNASVSTNQAILEVFGSGAKILRVYWGPGYRMLTGPGDAFTDLVVSPVSNQWYHVEIGIDPVAQTLDAWVDGVRKLTSAPFYQATSNIDSITVTGYSTATVASYLDNLRGERVDTTPPGPVNNFTATPGDTQNVLSWTNPADADFTGTRILFKTSLPYPSGPNDATATVIYDQSGTIYAHSGLTNGVTYYYSAFAHDAALNYSTGVNASATPAHIQTLGPVTSFKTYGGNQRVDMAWTNPTNPDPVGIKILCKAGSGYPMSPTDPSATVIYDALGTSCSHTGLNNGTKYYYAAYAYTGPGDYSAAAQSSTYAAAEATIPTMKGLANSVIRAVKGNVVTAAFSGSFYIQDPVNPYGLKVSTTENPLPSIGQKVDVLGSMTGLPGVERSLSCTGNWIRVTDPGPVTIVPAALNNKAVGGVNLNDKTPGVVGGVGANNVGLLVRVCGKVTQMQAGQYFYVDDGCGLKDGTKTSNIDNVGVRIKVSPPSDVSTGKYVVVTGIVSPFDSSGLRRQILPSASGGPAGVQVVGP